MQEDLEIEPGVIARDGRLHVLDSGLLARDPAALLRVFQHTQSYDLQFGRRTWSVIAECARDFKLPPTGSGAGRRLLEILSRPGAAAAVRAMANHGVLQSMVPQFGELMCLVPGDAAHRFTVGEHSIRTVEQLEVILAGSNDQLADAFSRVRQFEVLFVAALLHDIGKLDSGRDHTETGAVRARRIAAELGMCEEACNDVEFLVRRHLLMAETARLRNLHQRKTIQDFVAVVGDPQLLDMLFLLTAADYRAVGTKNWSQVQLRFLLELHERARVALRSPERPGPDIERHKRMVRRELTLANLPREEVTEHCDSLPASYLLNSSPEELAAHIAHVRTVRAGSPAVDITDDREAQFTQLTVVAFDRTGLLSEIAGVLHALAIDVHAAQIFTRHATDDIAIDILYIDFEGRQLSEIKKSQLEGDLLPVLSGGLTIGKLLERQNKTDFEKPRDLQLRTVDGLSDHETVVEARCSDVPGLLYHLTRSVSELGWNIHSARVATWGHQAQDAFYVTGPDGGKLAQDAMAHLTERMTG